MSFPCRACGESFEPKPYQIEKRDYQCRSCRNALNRTGRPRNRFPLKHGMCGTPTYKTWKKMIQRCTNPRSKAWANYGGHGIKIDPAWFKFESFLSDMGDRPVGTTLDRIDNNGNYEPGNCRWATKAEQTRNTRNNHLLEYKGEIKCLRDWALASGINPTTFENRILIAGWNMDRAMETPVLVHKRRTDVAI